MSEIDAFMKWLDAQAAVTALAGIADDEIIPTWPDTKSGLFNEYPQLTVGALRAFNASARQKGEWLPIETAPKDFSTEFDGWNGGRLANVIWGHPEGSPKGHLAWCISEYQAGYGWSCVEVKGLTHWMPLPVAP